METALKIEKQWAVRSHYQDCITAAAEPHLIVRPDDLHCTVGDRRLSGNHQEVSSAQDYRAPIIPTDVHGVPHRLLCLHAPVRAQAKLSVFRSRQRRWRARTNAHDDSQPANVLPLPAVDATVHNISSSTCCLAAGPVLDRMDDPPRLKRPGTAVRDVGGCARRQQRSLVLCARRRGAHRAVSSNGETRRPLTVGCYAVQQQAAGDGQHVG